MSFFRENIDAMDAYVPGEQPPAGAKVIKLNTNENPYPPSPATLAALGDFDGDALRRYPDAMATAFRQAASHALGVGADWIIPGNGSDDLIMMLARACAAPDRAIAYAVPTFEFYRAQALVEGARRVEVPYGEDFALPVEALAEANAALTFVANPNSPSGTAATVEQLDDLAARLEGVLAIDEAYADFAEQSALPLAKKHENVIVLRTLSKGYSLAGLRLGFAVCGPAIRAGLLKTKAIYNVSATACAVGAAAMADQAHKNANAEKIKASRRRLTESLEALGLRVWPSQANFVMVRPPDGQAEGMYQNLKNRGILVRYFKQPSLQDKLRITVGMDADNAALLGAMAELAGEESD